MKQMKISQDIFDLFVGRSTFLAKISSSDYVLFFSFSNSRSSNSPADALLIYTLQLLQSFSMAKRTFNFLQFANALLLNSSFLLKFSLKNSNFQTNSSSCSCLSRYFSSSSQQLGFASAFGFDFSFIHLIRRFFLSQFLAGSSIKAFWFFGNPSLRPYMNSIACSRFYSKLYSQFICCDVFGKVSCSCVLNSSKDICELGCFIFSMNSSVNAPYIPKESCSCNLFPFCFIVSFSPFY